MSEGVKVSQTTMMKGAGVSGHNPGVGPASPVRDIGEYLEYLFMRHSALETPPWQGPQAAHLTSSIKKDRQ
jgi:hypothetical protein